MYLSFLSRTRKCLKLYHLALEVGVDLSHARCQNLALGSSYLHVMHLAELNNCLCQLEDISAPVDKSVKPNKESIVLDFPSIFGAPDEGFGFEFIWHLGQNVQIACSVPNFYSSLQRPDSL